MSQPPKPAWLMPAIVGIAVIAIIAIVIIAVVINKSPTNQSNGNPCTKASQCQSGYCDPLLGTCADQPCQASGLPCTSDSNCCTGSHCDSSGFCSQPDSWVAVTGGYNVGSTDVTSKSLGTCQSECTSDSKCVAVAYQPGSDDDSGECSLVNSIPSTPLYTNGVTSYFKKTAGNTLIIPGSFVGQKGSSRFTVPGGVSDCDAACRKQGTSCVAYSVDSKNTCWLAPNLDSLNAGTNDPTITSYVL